MVPVRGNFFQGPAETDGRPRLLDGRTASTDGFGQFFIAQHVNGKPLSFAQIGKKAACSGFYRSHCSLVSLALMALYEDKLLLASRYWRCSFIGFGASRSLGARA